MFTLLRYHSGKSPQGPVHAHSAPDPFPKTHTKAPWDTTCLEDTRQDETAVPRLSKEELSLPFQREKVECGPDAPTCSKDSLAQMSHYRPALPEPPLLLPEVKLHPHPAAALPRLFSQAVTVTQSELFSLCQSPRITQATQCPLW